jgi:RimJ/RimL family protein N-acetyltransferase
MRPADRQLPIETARLTLRLPKVDDAQALMEIHQDPQVLPAVTLAKPPGDLTVAWRNVALMVGDWHLGGCGQWTVVENESGAVIGRVGLWNPEGWPGIELGWIIRRSRWGKGFATEAAGAALAWAWEHVKTDHIISIIAPDSAASIRVAEKIRARMEREGTPNGAEMLFYSVSRS